LLRFHGNNGHPYASQRYVVYLHFVQF
jgi:hypothetical protein